MLEKAAERHSPRVWTKFFGHRFPHHSRTQSLFRYARSANSPINLSRCDEPALLWMDPTAEKRAAVLSQQHTLNTLNGLHKLQYLFCIVQCCVLSFSQLLLIFSQLIQPPVACLFEVRWSIPEDFPFFNLLLDRLQYLCKPSIFTSGRRK